MPSPNVVERTRLSLRASRLSVRAALAISAYEAERILRPRPGLEADAKRRLGRAMLAGAGLEVVVEGPVPKGRAARLVVANHRSAFDIALMLSLLEDPVLLSRGDLADWPVIGRLAQHGDTLFVDRADKTDGARAIRSMRRVLERHRTLVVFPEGTTHADPCVRPFQGGAFVAARGLDVDLVPVGIAYTPGLEWNQPTLGEHLQKVLGSARPRVAVVFGEPSRSHGRRSAHVVAELQATVERLFARATAAVTG